VLKYYTFFPLVAWLPPVLEPWIEGSFQHVAIAAAALVAAHWVLRTYHRRMVREYTGRPGLEEDEEEFPMKLGLRY
jgi:hypothetical protein